MKEFDGIVSCSGTINACSKRFLRAFGLQTAIINEWFRCLSIRR